MKYKDSYYYECRIASVEREIDQLKQEISRKIGIIDKFRREQLKVENDKYKK